LDVADIGSRFSARRVFISEMKIGRPQASTTVPCEKGPIGYLIRSLVIRCFGMGKIVLQ